MEPVVAFEDIKFQSYQDHVRGQGYGQSKSKIFCCNVNARAYTKVGIALYMIFPIILMFILTLALCGILFIPPSSSSSSSQTKFDGAGVKMNVDTQDFLQMIRDVDSTVLTMVVFFSIILVIVPSMALYGVNRENLCLISFWVVFLSFVVSCLIGTTIGSLAQLTKDSTGDQFIYFFRHFLSLILNTFFLVATIKFRKEVITNRQSIFVFRAQVHPGFVTDSKKMMV